MDTDSVVLLWCSAFVGVRDVVMKRSLVTCFSAAMFCGMSTVMGSCFVVNDETISRDELLGSKTLAFTKFRDRCVI
jgi:hypothetical protein